MVASARSETAVLAGAVFLGIAACYLVSLPIDSPIGALVPFIFSVPLALTLVWLKHLRWLGAAFFIVAIVAGFYAAVYASMFAHSRLGVSLCIFGCTAEEIGSNNSKMQGVGAVGGLVGGLATYIALGFLGGALRDRTAFVAMLISLPLLTLFGSIGFSQMIPFTTTQIVNPEAPNARLLQLFLFVVPWQTTFGATLAFLMRRHTPKARSPQAQAAALR